MACAPQHQIFGVQPPQAFPRDAPPDGRVRIPARAAYVPKRVMRASGTRSGAQKGPEIASISFRFLQRIVTYQGVISDFCGKFFSRLLLPAGRRAPRPDRPVASGVRRNGFDGTGHSVFSSRRRRKNKYRTTAALSRNFRPFCRQEDRRRFVCNSGARGSRRRAGRRAALGWLAGGIKWP